MPVTVNMKKGLDLPVWEWCRFAPFASAASYTTCMDESTGGRYMYYLGASTFARYDTVTDGWQMLASPPLATATVMSMRYSVYGGYRANCLAATSTTLTCAGLAGEIFVGKKVRIISGTGAGQERTISAQAAPVIVESGSASSVSVYGIADAQTIPKKWKINQWIGYQVRVVFGTGACQVRKILYNDTNTLYVSDQAGGGPWQAGDNWSNNPFNIVAPYAALATGANYFIEKVTMTVPAWTTQPDTTSTFAFLTGQVWVASGKSLAAGSISLQMYDVASDTWLTKQCPGTGIMPVLGQTDIAIERTGELSGAFATGSVTSGAVRSITDSGASWTVDQWAGFQVRVVKNESEQRMHIIGNSATTLYFGSPFVTTPDNTYTYSIYGETNNIWFCGNSQSSIYKYLIEEDMWCFGEKYDSGITCNMTHQFAGQIPFAVTIAVNTAAMLSVHATPTVGGTGYKVGDICNVTQATGGKVRVEAVTAGVVTAVSLFACGTSGTYTTGTGKATSNSIGTGTGLTVNILTVGTSGRVTTAMNHNLLIGDQVVMKGSSTAGWNTTYTLLGADSLTAYDIAAPNTTTPVATASQGTTTIVDPTKDWVTNEHIGKLVILYTVGVIPTAQIRRISANTATTLTVPTITAGVNGTSKYVIQDSTAFGRARQYQLPEKDSVGYATSGSGTTLVDSTKNWEDNCWVGYKVQVVSGTGYDKGEVVITSNTATTLNAAAFGFTADATTNYRIMDTWGQVTGNVATTTLGDTTKNWPVNLWAGKTVRITSGTGQTQESIISSNTATVLTFAAITAPDTTSTYTILDMHIRNAGISMTWAYGSTTDKGKYIYIPRGGSFNTFDRYNITTDRIDLTIFAAPQGEQLVSGTMYAYDNADRIYFTNASPSTVSGVAGSSRIHSLDLETRMVDSSGQTPYAHSTAIIGNKMEIVTTIDGLKFLYVMRHTGAELWRTLLWW